MYTRDTESGAITFIQYQFTCDTICYTVVLMPPIDHIM